jgi:serine/threonine protein kinase
MLNSLTLPSLLSRYEAEELIGHGDDASVYRAIDSHTGEMVAIKVFDQRMELDASFVANFRREARRASMLRHPNVVRTFGYGYADQHYYLTLEYIDDGTFERLIPAPGEMPAPEAMRALLSACQGLQYIHEQGVLDRNLEPSNILLRSNGEAVVSGLGPLHQFASSGLTMTNILIESLNYASPEQLAGGTMTVASDIYSFGLILYQTCTGRLPFTEGNLVQLAMQQINEEPPSPRLFNPSLSTGLEDAILRCLRKDPAQRYGSIKEVGDALTAAMPAPDQTLTLMQAINLGPVDTSTRRHTRTTSRTPVRALLPKGRFRSHARRKLPPAEPARVVDPFTVPVMVETLPTRSKVVQQSSQTSPIELDGSDSSHMLPDVDDADRTMLMPIVTPEPTPRARSSAVPVQRSAAPGTTSRQRRQRPTTARRLIHNLAERVAEATA